MRLEVQVCCIFLSNADINLVKCTFCKVHSLIIKIDCFVFFNHKKNTHFLSWRSIMTLWPWCPLLHREALILNTIHYDFVHLSLNLT